MKVRAMTIDDITALKASAAASGFPYPELSSPLIEAVSVVTNDEGEIIVACAAHRMVELYLYGGEVESDPSDKKRAIDLLHIDLARKLRAAGYAECSVFIPPQIVVKFAQRLIKTWGWARHEWTHLTKSF